MLRVTHKVAKQMGLLPSDWPEIEIVRERKPSSAEELFGEQCVQYRLPRFEPQLRFAKKAMGRQWRFDFAFPDYHLAVEIQGVVVRRIGGQLVTMGRHANVQGMRDDHAKHNAAILLGWSVLQFMPSEIKPKRAIEITMQVLAARGWKHGAVVGWLDPSADVVLMPGGGELTRDR